MPENNRLPKEIAFSHAMKLAEQFVANGDVRLRGNSNESSDEMAMLGDLIDTLYNVVQSTYANLDA
jgi:hypothetical protein